MESTNKKGNKHGRGALAPLSEATRRRIFLLMRERGLDEDSRHYVQWALIGKQSLRDFTEAEGRELLTYLIGNPKPGILNIKSHSRIRRTRPDGIIEIHVASTITEPQIRKAYALIHQVYEMECSAQGRGLLEKPEDWTEDPRARLDGWARKISNNEALQLGELMKDEAGNLIEILKERVEWLTKRIRAIKTQKQK